MMSELPLDISGTPKALAADHLFNVNEQGKKLHEDTAKWFFGGKATKLIMANATGLRKQSLFVHKILMRVTVISLQRSMRHLRAILNY